MNTIDAKHCVVVLVDFQERLLPSINLGAQVVEEALYLASVAQMIGIRVIGTEQNPNGLGHNVPALRARCETTLTKMHFDACADGLLELLPAGAGKTAPDIVIAGCEAHVCLLQTALGLLA